MLISVQAMRRIAEFKRAAATVGGVPAGLEACG